MHNPQLGARSKSAPNLSYLGQCQILNPSDVINSRPQGSFSVSCIKSDACSGNFTTLPWAMKIAYLLLSKNLLSPRKKRLDGRRTGLEIRVNLPLFLKSFRIYYDII